MSRILLIHGWSFDASIWEAVVRALPDHVCMTLDLGYFGTPRVDIPAGLDLAVGHSFGCLWAMQNAALGGIPLVAVNGFPRFSSCPDFPHGTPERVLARMQKRLQEAPEEVLKAFRERCGAPAPPSGCVLDRLAEDLERLQRDDARGLAGRQPRLALASVDDPLLPLPLSEQAFPGILRVLPQGGHLLPWTHPEAVAACIREGLGG